MSVDLTTFFPENAGDVQNIEAKALAWKIVGTGTFSDIASNQVNFSGNGTNPFSGAGFSISISLNILDDQDCQINLNGDFQAATYAVNDDGYLVVTIPNGSEAGEIQIISGAGGTYLYLDIPSGHDVWVGPASSSQRRLYLQSHNGRTLLS
jgi:hypothetical protein